MKKQYQHIVPQVYLKGFGFQKSEYGNKWMVSVNNRVKDIWENREIRRFLGEYNLYDLTTNQTVSNRVLETELHGGVEGRLNSIIKFLETNDSIPRAIHMDIAETAANFLCRSKLVLGWIKRLLEIKPADFWKMISDDNGILDSKEQGDELFKRLMQLPEKDRINNFMLFFMLHVKLILCNTKLTVFKNPDDNLLFTGGNPVVLKDVGFGELIKSEFESYFALDKNHLAYFYWHPETTDLDSIRGLLINDTIQTLSEEHLKYYCSEYLFPMNDEFIIAPINKSEIGL